MNPLKYSLAVESVLVTLTGQDGKEVTYELREMMASVRDKYLDQLGERMKTGPDGKVSGVKKFDGLQTALLEVCLFDAEGQPVKKAVIQNWPARLVSSLFDEAQKLNQLSATAEEAIAAAKKD